MPSIPISDLLTIILRYFADEGFLGFEWQTSIFDQPKNLIWTPLRQNQYVQNSKAVDRWLSSSRERMKESFFYETRNTGRNLDAHWQKQLSVYAPSYYQNERHLLGNLLHVDFGINVQTFQIIGCIHCRHQS